MNVKAILIPLFLLGSLVFASGQSAIEQSARFKIKIVCYHGKIGSDNPDMSVYPSPQSIFPGTHVKSAVRTSGQESEFTWTFLGRNGDKDDYRFTFTRQTKADAATQTTSTKVVSFDGKQAVLFTDDLHTFVIESPSEENLKPAK